MFEETAQNMCRIKALVSRLNVRQTALQAGVSRESVYSLLRDGPLSHWPTYRKLTAFLAQWEDEHGMTQEECTMRKICALVAWAGVREVALAAGLSRQSVYRVLRDGPRGRQGRYPSFLVLAELVDTFESENGPLL